MICFTHFLYRVFIVCVLFISDIPKTQWYGIDKTGVKAYDDVSFDDLVRNQLRKNYDGSVDKSRR